MEDLKLALPVFKGPLDLLLHLVKINEMDIHEIPIAEITAQYLSYLKLMESLDLEIAGDFLVMAATLVNIKLRSLLPAGDEEDEEEEEIEDLMTARMLMERLVEYRKFKEAASSLREAHRHRSETFVRDVALPKMAESAEDDELQGDMDRLLEVFSRVLRFVEADHWHLVTEEEFAVEEKMDEVDARLAEEGRLEIEALFRQSRSKLEMIVYLLAILELCHLRRVVLNQAESFGPMHLLPGPGVEDPREPALAVAPASAEAEVVDLANSEEPLAPPEGS